MRTNSVSTWSNDLMDKGLVFFAQSIEEMLFHHSHDSFKVPTLNFKFLCYDILETISNIEDNTLDAGNLHPLIDEFKISYKRDPIIQTLFGNNIETIFEQKNEQGVYKSTFSDICRERTSENTRIKLKKVLVYLIEELNNDDKYYKSLVARIRELVKLPIDQENENELHTLSQILLSELVNRSYSIEFLYNAAIDTFFFEENICDAEKTFDKFIQIFTFKKREYVVYFPVSAGIKDDLLNCFNLSIENNVFEMFNNIYPYIGKIKLQAIDPERARIQVADILEVFLSIVQYDKHSKKTFNIHSVCVVDIETQKSYFLKEPIKAILRGKRDKETVFSKNICPHQMRNLLSAISLHATAIKSNDIHNQFLNLWTGIEVLIPVERKGSFSRVNQISNALTTVMSITYFYSLFYHLKNDVSAVVSNYDDLVNDVEGKGICKLVYILSQKEYQDKKDAILGALSQYPLLKYRLQKYEHLLNNPKEMQTAYLYHSERISQQIMRIYRTRNMIVHDGSDTVYIDLILQNLHFYLDTLIDTIYAVQKKGYQSITAVFKKMIEVENKMLNSLKKDVLDKTDMQYFCTIGTLYTDLDTH